MKRIFSILIITALLLTPATASGADVLYRMLHADEVKSFQKDQSALIVGQLTARGNTTFTVKVLKVLSGKVAGGKIKVNNAFEYGWATPEMKPRVKDFCVMSLKRTGSQYKKAWGIFKADSGNYRTLHLVISNNSPCRSDMAAIQYYVNSGGKAKDFYFIGGTVYRRGPNDVSQQIYPPKIIK